MSLKRNLSLAVPMAFVGSLLLVFQNCAPKLENEEVELEVDPLQAMHVDRHHGTVETMEKTVVETRADDLLTDRVLLVNQLVSVFGPSARTLDDDRISTDLTTFGSPCSIYEAFNYYNESQKKVAVSDSSRSCAYNNSAAAMRATMYPHASVTRLGVMNHLCLRLSTDKVTLPYALKRIDAAKTPEPNRGNIVKAFRLFYRNAPEPTEELIESLQVMMPGISEDHATQASDWSPVLYTICVSPGWQLL